MQPTYPPPARREGLPPKRRLPRWAIILIAIVGGVLFLFIAIGVIAVATSGQGNTAQGTPTIVATHAIPATAKPVVKVTPAPAVTHGYPHIGGPLSDFVGKYGHAHNGDQYTVAPFTLFTITETRHGAVTQLIAIGGLDWSNDKTQAACAVFLPHGATQFNTDAPFIDYHTPLGEAVMQVAAGQCVLGISLS